MINNDWQDTPCWEFWGYIKENGYGRVTINGRQLYPHRVSYESFIGSIPKGMDVCHRCDNRKCMNPVHLFVGSRQDNMVDAKIKGRIQRGESRYNSVLNESLVISARKRNELGEKIVDIAKDIGVGKTTLGNAIRRKTWRHVL